MGDKEKIEYIVDWLKKYAIESKTTGFVIGISGGIDSAVTSTLCAKTGLPTICVEMPIDQALAEVARAENHISFLKKKYSNVTSIKVYLSNSFENLKESLPKISNNITKENLALANTKARLRMTTLYYYAGTENKLVAGTGNKIEDFGIGFFTKYGDGGVDISPIADLLKSEVFQLARELKINPHIIDARPTDGLFGDDRTDEDQIGASYDELEWAMNMVDMGKKSDDFTGRDKKAFDIYTQRNRANKHKMLEIPVCKIPKK
ncbi:MAG: NAD(+) synthase [Flavobacteriaceae bacterium]|nr:NAD(+) synthase [Flavobacteriaceae bacterium]